MKEDIQEIKDIVKELTDAGLHPGDKTKAMELALQIQQNRILRKGLVVKWKQNPQAPLQETSIFEFFEQTFIEGFANINGTLQDLGMK